MESYNKYGPYLKAKFGGHKVYKVVVDAGFTCPNRDGSKGYGGCTYCNVDSFTPDLARNTAKITEQVTQGIARARQKYGATKFIIYFQPNSNTYAAVESLKLLYDEALSVDSPDIVGLSIGTRPDLLTEEKLDLLESYTKRYYVDLEIGMESIYDYTLRKINRGCSHQDFINAVQLFNDRNIDLCVHTIFGFPWETEEMMLSYAAAINEHRAIKFVKLHHLHIVNGSIMGVLYKRHPFKLFTLPEYAAFLAKFIPLLRQDIIIQRVFGVADTEYLIAPDWGVGKSSIQTYIDQLLSNQKVLQGSEYSAF